MSDSTRFPAGPDEITTEWLSEALGTDVVLVTRDRIGIGTGVLGQIYRVVLRLAAADHPLASLVVKLPPEGAASRALADALHMGQREANSYLAFAGRTPLTMPVLHYGAYDEGTGRFAMVIEDLGGRRMVDQLEGCSTEDAVIVLDALAAHHAMFWGPAGLSGQDWVVAVADPPNPAAITQALRESWPTIEEHFADLLPPALFELAHTLPDFLPTLMAELSEAPRTLLHGDLRLDNLYFATSPEQPPVVVADWQLAMAGHGAYDLAYFLPQNLQPSLGPAAIEPLLRRYHESLVNHGVPDYSFDRLLTDFRRAVLFHLSYPLVAGSIDLTNDRAVELFRSMLGRAVAAVTYFDATDFAR